MVQIRQTILFTKNAPVPHGGFDGKTPNVAMWISLQLSFGVATENWLWYKPKLTTFIGN
jgi:hypothetical protein